MKQEASGRTPSYTDCFAAQVGTIGRAAQERLRRSTVLVAGAGGLGTAVSSILAMAGVGRLFVVDPQKIEPENFNRSVFIGPSDIGKAKARVLAASLGGRPHLTVSPVVGRAESVEVRRIVKDVHLIVSASNTVTSRAFLAHLASANGLPHVSAAITDGRQAKAGFIVTSVPHLPDLACPACFLTPRAQVNRGESLLAPVVAVIGALAAYLAVELLIAGQNGPALEHGNCLTIDLDGLTVESLRILRRPDCPACGSSLGL